jgi:glycosyltransferase involved in cell wall biosynthesis
MDLKRRPQCVAMVTPVWPAGRAPNGIATYTSYMAPAFRQEGVRAVLLAWDLGEQTKKGDSPAADGDLIDISSFKPRRTLLGRASVKARHVVAKAGFGDPHFPMLKAAVRAALARFPIQIVEIEEAFGRAGRIAKLKRIPVVTRLHGPWFLNGKTSFEQTDAAFHRRVRRERPSVALADAVTSPSQDVLDRTREFYGLPLKEARVIPCPIETRPDDRLWNLEGADRNRILFAGRFDFHKGGDLMIDAFVKLARSRPSLTLDFVGPDRGILDSAGRLIHLVESLQSRALDAQVARRIVVHGQKSMSEIDDFRRRALITVVPSRYETFGYTAVEALRLGCPLVVGDAGGLREIVRDGETGLCFRAGDSVALAVQIERLLGDPQLAARLGQAGRADVCRRYSPGAIAESTLDLYASVVERWSAKSRAPGGRSSPIA